MAWQAQAAGFASPNEAFWRYWKELSPTPSWCHLQDPRRQREGPQWGRYGISWHSLETWPAIAGAAPLLSRVHPAYPDDLAQCSCFAIRPSFFPNHPLLRADGSTTRLNRGWRRRIGEFLFSRCLSASGKVRQVAFYVCVNTSQKRKTY